MKIFGIMVVATITCLHGLIALVLYRIAQEDTFDGSSGITVSVSVLVGALLLFVQVVISLAILSESWEKGRRYAVTAQIPLLLSVTMIVAVFVWPGIRRDAETPNPSFQRTASPPLN